MMLEQNMIHCGDLFHFIDKVEDNSIDLIVCDGPYGVTNNDWDRFPRGIQLFNLELLRVFSRKIKKGGSLYLFGKSNCVDFIDYRPFFNLKTKIIW